MVICKTSWKLVSWINCYMNQTVIFIRHRGNIYFYITQYWCSSQVGLIFLLLNIIHIKNDQKSIFIDNTRQIMCQSTKFIKISGEDKNVYTFYTKHLCVYIALISSGLDSQIGFKLNLLKIVDYTRLINNDCYDYLTIIYTCLSGSK